MSAGLALESLFKIRGKQVIARAASVSKAATGFFTAYTGQAVPASPFSARLPFTLLRQAVVHI